VKDLVSGSGIRFTERGPFAIPDASDAWHGFRVDPTSTR
jgi:hypothetical protein